MITNYLVISCLYCKLSAKYYVIIIMHYSYFHVNVNEVLVLSMSGVTDSKTKDLTFEFGLCLEIVSHFSVTNSFF
jgi:hypothetical protein